MQRKYGVTVNKRYLRLRFEKLDNGSWYAEGFGICIWKDSSKPITVAERGVW